MKAKTKKIKSLHECCKMFNLLFHP
jgi:hypothetical protein